MGVNLNTKFNEHSMYPNLKFAAPEVSAMPAKCSQWSDLYSVGCLMYFLLALEKN